MYKLNAARTFNLTLESGARIPGTTAADATFNLSRDLLNVKSIAVVHACAGNNLHNVTEDNYDMRLSSDDGQTYTVIQILPSGSYTPAEYIDAIALRLTPYGSSVVLVGDNTIQWSFGTGVFLDGTYKSSAATLGIAKQTRVTGTFRTSLFLGAPYGIAFECQSFNQSDKNVFGDGRRTNDAFFRLPLQNGLGTIENYSPPYLTWLDVGGGCLGNLSVRLVDPSTGRILSEINNWYLNLLVVIN
jgi:hypothetical protein